MSMDIKIVHDIAAVKRAENDHIEKMFTQTEKLALVKAGILGYENGKYFVNQRKVDKYLYEQDRDKRNRERENYISKKTDEIASRRSARWALGSVNKKHIKRRVTRKYDRMMKKEEKREIKHNSRLHKLKSKFGFSY